MMRDEVLRVLHEAIEKAAWSLARDQPGPGTLAYEGVGGNWRFLVVGFEAEGDAFAYDGTGVTTTGGPVVVRMTREIAEKAFRLAQKQAS